MSSHFIDVKSFKKAGFPPGDVVENIKWIMHGRAKPYSKETQAMLETMSYATFEALIYRDPTFRDRIWNRFKKQDDPILSTTSGIWEPLYGLLAHSQIHREMSLLSALQMVPWVHDGSRLFMADPDPQGSWMAEEDVFPDVGKPDFDLYKCDSKWALVVWEIFEKAIQHASRNEGINLVTDTMEIYSNMHKEFIDKALLACAQTEAAASSADRYNTAPVAVETIDRIISSDEEEDEHGHDDNDWYDPYATDIDRDAGTDHDSVVLMDTSADRAISDDLMRELIRNCEDEGMRSPAEGGKGFILTGRDMRDELAALHQAAKIYTPGLDSAGRRGIKRVRFGVNGVQTCLGQQAGFKVASYDDYPIIVDKYCPKDGKSRIYLIDGATLRLKYLLPTQYLSTDPSNWIQLRQLKRKFGFLSVLELECLNFRRQGKIRDLL